MADTADEAETFITLTQSLAVGRIREMLQMPGDECCEECGEPIEAARRKALPSVKTCLTCQEIIELKSRHS
ncbi:TraR/DksA C4-type zinc finger protein [Erwinia persicina]|uniref:TraR/DksA C4-type zinc finger protein n=1 Tax=Erwinia persicina TaxID=55211 RepID=A0A4U3EL15_9GAMM|nr:TraR/DksA C4-type zinc finger protein [Erwinia persicina]MBD8109434.1 TraR/DksA C4-type zinc finger protein [Erwinia persicina]MBD8170255.1 TraR/DksA C4-type zinc finger protein [Erwinia persicina]MBD8212574.1 TraR/DksA C4-type zinc finger protein [Erwinia persicina]TKJ80620.1 hypothetical protein EpCFBP13511_24395 [Erwinia persicina]